MAAGDSGGRSVNAIDVIVEAGKLAAEGKPYALATVVTVVRPASARRGDRALVTPDGTVTGWIGGACSEPTVVREALRALADREPRLARMEGGCASEGVVEVLIEPVLPAPLLAIVGESPAARTLGALARTVGWRVRGDGVDGADAVVVATMGRGDEELLAAALAAGAGYVGLVASARRAATVLAALRESGLDEEAVLRVRAPAGLDLGPSSQEEIAVAILAELVAWRHTRGEVPVPAHAEVEAEAVDPVCGMTVAVGPDALQTVHEGAAVYFCSAHCKARFEAEPDRYSGLRAQ
jgi:xanthine dehydrogenase accessory factor